MLQEIRQEEMYQGIRMEHVTKIYRTRKLRSWWHSQYEEKIAVQDLSLHIPSGQITGLLGLNGAGKTTTIKMLSTLLLPTSGTITLDGIDITQEQMGIRKRINMIAGGERLVYWRMTGRENLWYFGQLYDVDPVLLDRRINELLSLVGLKDAANTVVERYSKGMKQRLQIARGLINDPSYLFLDEPTIGLDVPIARDLRAMVRRLSEDGKGILLTSHYLQEVEELCSYIYVIDRGQVIAEGSSQDLKALTHQEHRISVQLVELTTEVEIALQQLSSETGARVIVEPGIAYATVIVRHSQDLSGRVAMAVAGSGAALLKLEVQEPNLEDAIMALTPNISSAKEASYAAN